jgi:predicted dehydrogenase
VAPLRTAVVGAGLMGRWHAAYARRAGATVVAVVDPDLAAARELAGRHAGAAAFSELAEGLRERPGDVVHVCTPTASHFTLAREALEAGAHVMVEKPAAATRAEAEALVETARAGRRILAAAHQMPFQRGFLHLRVALPRLGELVAVEFRMCSAGGEGRTAEERRTILLEVLPHPHSLLRALLQESYAPAGLQVAVLTDDDLVLTGRSRDARIDVSLSLRGRPPRNELRVTGTRGSAVADLFHGYCAVESGGTSRAAKVLRPLVHAGRVLAASSANLLRRSAAREPAYPGLRRLIDAMYAAAREAGPSPVDAAEILDSVALMERVRATRID